MMFIVSKNKLIISIIIISVLAILGGVFFGFKGENTLPLGEVKVGEKVFKVEIAKNMISRARGLSGREGLDEGEGMLFIFDNLGSYGFWMKEMKFPIDIIWIKENRIVGFSENVQPEPKKSFFNLKTYHPPEEVDKVLEVKAGAVSDYGFKVGDEVAVNQF